MNVFKNSLKAPAIAIMLTFGTAAAFTGISGLTPQAAAHAETEQEKQARETIEAAWNNFVRSNRNNSAVRTHFIGNFDMSTLSSRTVGPEWRGASREQKAEIQREYTKFLIGKFGPQLRRYANSDVSFRSYRHTKNPNILEIRSSVTGATNSIDFFVSKYGRDWKAYNARVQGVLINSHFRKEFSRHMNGKNPIQSLIDYLKQENQKMGVASNFELENTETDFATKQFSYGLSHG